MRVLLALAVLLGAALASEHSLRGPASDRAWVFGYGSLINAESRAKAGETGPAIPATVAGVRRQWAACVRNHHDGGYVAVALERGGAGDTVSGVIFSVPHSTLHGLDQRERGYNRVQIDWAECVASSVPVGLARGTCVCVTAPTRRTAAWSSTRTPWLRENARVRARRSTPSWARRWPTLKRCAARAALAGVVSAPHPRPNPRAAPRAALPRPAHLAGVRGRGAGRAGVAAPGYAVRGPRAL